jgi:uncharacterized membrane protein
MKHSWAFLLAALMILAGGVQAAVIHGSVYDLELNTLSKAMVSINTTPRQVMVSQNGSYSFAVPPGAYEIVARQNKLDLLAKENFTVKQDGDYVLDLILFPDLSTDEELLNETLDIPNYEEPVSAAPNSLIWIVGAVIIVALLAALAYAWKKKAPEAKTEKKEEKQATKADLEDILAFVRKEGGRTTQKDLRKAIPYSEAKISLMIAELESQGKLKKIKKGRGNIIVLP